MPKCNFNNVAKQGCSPVNLLHIFRTPLLKNTSGQLFMSTASLFLITSSIFYVSNKEKCLPVSAKCYFSCQRMARPICGHDGRTYMNECIMRRNACKRKKATVKAYDGYCKNGKLSKKQPLNVFCKKSDFKNFKNFKKTFFIEDFRATASTFNLVALYSQE